MPKKGTLPPYEPPWSRGSRMLSLEKNTYTRPVVASVGSGAVQSDFDALGGNRVCGEQQRERAGAAGGRHRRRLCRLKELDCRGRGRAAQPAAIRRMAPRLVVHQPLEGLDVLGDRGTRERPGGDLLHELRRRGPYRSLPKYRLPSRAYVVR